LKSEYCQDVTSSQSDLWIKHNPRLATWKDIGELWFEASFGKSYPFQKQAQLGK
jgi:hypothetical protein